MTVEDQIAAYIARQPEPKRRDLQALHELLLGLSPRCRLWFLDGRNADGKVVANPNIGYGETRVAYAGGDTRDFYRIGLSANATGLSVYVMGLADKTHLPTTWGARLGKAKVTGYCIRFRSTRDIDLAVLEELVARYIGEGAKADAAADRP